MSWPWKEVFLARHGETEWNVVGRRQGQLDSPLTAIGRHNADQIAETAAHLDIDNLFASPQGRADATARVVARRIDVPLHTVAELAEIDHGSLAGLTNDEIERTHPGELDRRAADKYRWCFPGGESYSDADRRSAKALGKATSATRPLIVSHNMISRMLIRNLVGIDPDEALRYDIPHGAVVRVVPRTGLIETLSH